MKVDFAFVCDYAEAGPKINALGIGFDTIYAAQTPVIHRHFSLVFQLRTSVVEAGQKNVEVHLIDEDGKQMIPPMKGQVNIPKVEGAPESLGRFVMEFGNIQFQRYGTYSIRVAVDGIEMISVPFRVSPPPPQRTR